MKKVLTMFLALSIVLSLAACSGGSKEKETGSTDSANTQTAETGSADSANTPAAETASVDTSNWPSQPVNVMCPAASGGGTDLILRQLNEYFVAKTGQSFVIANEKGLGGYEKVHQAATDGYNFIAGTTTIFTSKEDGSLDYDWQDYAMVAFVPGANTTVIAVRADSEFQNINDLFNKAKEDPSSVVGGITPSGQPYMFALALKEAVGIDLKYVDAGTTGERNAALLGDQVDYIITNTTASAQYVESGDFRFIAIDGEERNTVLAPDVPTFKEQGIDFDFPSQPFVWLAPKGTPAEICEAFNKILGEMYADPDCKNDLLTLKYQTPDEWPSVEESVTMAQEFADALAPYIVK